MVRLGFCVALIAFTTSSAWADMTTSSVDQLSCGFFSRNTLQHGKTIEKDLRSPRIRLEGNRLLLTIQRSRAHSEAKTLVLKPDREQSSANSEAFSINVLSGDDPHVGGYSVYLKKKRGKVIRAVIEAPGRYGIVESVCKLVRH
jgi:hypothetical protein